MKPLEEQLQDLEQDLLSIRRTRKREQKQLRREEEIQKFLADDTDVVNAIDHFYSLRGKYFLRSLAVYTFTSISTYLSLGLPFVGTFYGWNTKSDLESTLVIVSLGALSFAVGLYSGLSYDKKNEEAFRRVCSKKYRTH